MSKRVLIEWLLVFLLMAGLLIGVLLLFELMAVGDVEGGMVVTVTPPDNPATSTLVGGYPGPGATATPIEYRPTRGGRPIPDPTRIDVGIRVRAYIPMVVK